jgi:hypothetical protein
VHAKYASLRFWGLPSIQSHAAAGKNGIIVTRGGTARRFGSKSE